MKHTLTAEDADRMNVGRSLDAGETGDDRDDFVKEGDSVEALSLPNGNRLVITGVNADGTVIGVEVESPDDDSDDYNDSEYVEDEPPYYEKDADPVAGNQSATGSSVPVPGQTDESGDVRTDVPATPSDVPTKPVGNFNSPQGDHA